MSSKELIHSEAEENTEEDKVQSKSLFARANALSSEEILRKYLLGGVAWRCLVLLRALGVEVSTLLFFIIIILFLSLYRHYLNL